MYLYDYVTTWEIFVSEILEAASYEAKTLINAFLAERLFPRVAG